MNDLDAFLDAQDPADWAGSSERAQLLARVAELEAQAQRAAEESAQAQMERAAADAAHQQETGALRAEVERLQAIHLRLEAHKTEATKSALLGPRLSQAILERDTARAEGLSLQRRLERVTAQRDEARKDAASLSPERVAARVGGMSDKDLAKAIGVLNTEWRRRASARWTRRTA